MNALSYIKNVGKSLGYTVFDVAREMNPTIASAIETNKEFSKELYNAIKDFEGTKAAVVNKVTSSEYWELAGEARTYLFEDLKSGKWYNKERKDKIEGELLGASMGGDFDFDDSDDGFNFDDSDASDDMDFDSAGSEDDSWDQTKEMEDMMDTVGEKVSSAVANATVRSADYIVESNKGIARKSAIMNKGLLDKVNAGIAAVNANISNLVPIGEALSTHVQNATVFYTKTNEYQEKALELLTTISQNTARPTEETDTSSSSSRSLSEIIDAEGILDLSMYMDVVKKNIEDMFSMITSMKDMMGGEEGGGNMLKSFIASPMEYAMKFIVEGLVPKGVRKVSDTFNKTISGVFSSLFMQLNDQTFSDNPLLQKLSELFGVSNSMKNTINTSAYNKGRVDFDGIARKSITEVIPTYLSKILSALTGNPETRYNFDTGKFVGMREIQQEREQPLKGEASSAGMYIREEFEDFLEGRDDAQKEAMLSMMDKFFEKSVEMGTMYNPRKDQDRETYGLDDSEIGNTVQKFLRDLLNSDKAYLLSNMNTNVVRARGTISSRFSNMERDGSVINSMFDNSTDENVFGKNVSAGLLNTKDKYNNDIFFYLQGIYQFTNGIYEQGGVGGRKSLKGLRGKGGKFKAAAQSVLKAIPDNNVTETEEVATTEERPSESQFQDIIKPLLDDAKYKKKVESLLTTYGRYSDIVDNSVKDELLEKVYELRRKKRADEKKAVEGKGFFDKLKDSDYVFGGIKDVVKGAENALESPGQAVSTLLNGINHSITNLIYGKDDQDPEAKDKGILGIIVNKTKETFSKMHEWINEHILNPLTEELDIHNVKDLIRHVFAMFGVNIDDTIKNVKNKLVGTKGEDGQRSGGILSGAINATKKNLKSAGGWVKNAFSSTLGKVVSGEEKTDGGGETTDEGEPSAANGGMVTKSGMISVSEGELIIPSEYNPFYSKATNKARQIKQEADVVNNFYGSFAKGGTVGYKDSFLDQVYQYGKEIGLDDSFLRQITGRESETSSSDDGESASQKSKKKPLKLNRKKRKSISRYIKSKQEEASKEETKEETSTEEEGTAQKATKKLEDTKAGKFFKDSVDELKNGISVTISKFFGSKEEQDKISKKINETSSKVLKELQVPDNLGGMLTGALIGGGATLLTGGLITPLFGAAIGAGSGLIMKSEKVQEFLFGDEKKGSKGLLPEDATKFIKDKLPGMAKAGTVGAILSMIPGIPGGPVAGLVLGSAISYVAQTDKVKDAIFGEKGTEGREWAEGVKEKIKTSLPRMGAGAIVGLVAGPFGLVPNIVIGAAVGLATTTNKFQETLFGTGKDGDEGIVGWIKKAIVEPIKNSIKPFEQAFKNLAKSISHSITRALYNAFKETIGIPLYKKLENTLLKPIMGVGGLILGAVKKVVAAPFSLIGAVGNRLRAGQIKSGTATYMSAAERVQYRNDKGWGTNAIGDEMAQMDEVLANTKSSQDLAKYAASLKSANELNKNSDLNRAQKEAKSALHSTSKGLLKQNINVKDTEKIMKYIQDGKSDKAREYLGKLKEKGLDQSVYDSALNTINQGIDTFGASKEKLGKAKEEQQKIYNDLSEKFGVKITEKNAYKYEDLIKSEIAIRDKKEKAKTPEERQEDYHVNVLTRFDKILNVISSIASKMGINVDPDKEEPTKPTTAEDAAEKVKEDVAKTTETSEEAEEILEDEPEVKDNGEKEAPKKKKSIMDRLTEAVGSLSGGIKDKKGKVYTTTSTGETIQQIQNAQGELITNMQDKETNDAVTRQRNVQESQIALAGKVGGISAAVTGLIGRLFGKKDDGEKTGSFLDTIKKFFIGENGLVSHLSALLNFITGGRLGKNGKLIGNLTASNLSSLLRNVVGPALLAAALTGKLDEFAEKWGFGSKENTTGAQTESGTSITENEDAPLEEKYNRNEEGEIVDDEGNVVDIKEVQNLRTDRDNLSQSLIKNTVRGALTGRRSVAGVILGRTGVGKAVSSVAKATANVTSSIGDDALNVLAKNNLCDLIIDNVSKFTQAMHKIPALSGIADKIDDMGLALTETLTKAASSSTAKAALDFAKKAAVVAQIAFIVADFTTGYEDARTTLGITDEPTVPQRIVSGLLRAAKNAIPVIGSLIPDNVVIDIFLKYIGPALGIDSSKILAQREKAQEDVAAYNEKHGTDLDVAKYNKSVLKDYTWTERIGNAARSTVEQTKMKASNIAAGIKEKGVGGYLKDTVTEMGSEFISSYKDSGGGISGIFSAIGDTFQNLLPGVLGEIAKKNMDIRASAFKGDLKGMWKISLDDFSGGGEANEDGIVTAVPGIFSKIIGQIPLLVSKISFTPVSLAMKLFGAIGDLFKGVVEKVKGTFNAIKEEREYGENLILTDSFNLGDMFTVQEPDAENPVGGLEKVLRIGARFSIVPFALLKRAFIGVGDLVKGIVGKVKGTFNAIQEEREYGESLIYSKTSTLSDMFTVTEPDPDNPMGGLEKALRIGARISIVPSLMAKRLFSNIGEFIGSIITKVKTGLKNYWTNAASIMQIARSGDPDRLSAFEPMAPDPNNPLGGITTGLLNITKIMYTPSAWMNKAFNTVANFVKGVITKVKNGFTNYVTNAGNMLQLAKSGDPDALAAYEPAATDPENPLGGVTTVLLNITRIMYTPTAYIKKAFNAAGDFVKGIIEKVRNGLVNYGTNVLEIQEIAKSGDTEALASYEPTASDPENPLGGITTGLINITRIMYTPTAYIKKAFNAVSDFIKGAVDTVKKSVSAIGENVEKIQELAKAGDTEKLSAYEATGIETENNPLAGLTSALIGISKFMYTPNAMMHSMFNTISKTFTSGVDAVKGNYKSMKTAIDDMKTMSDDGDLKGVMAATYTPENDNDPLKHLWKALFSVNKIFNTLAAAFKSLISGDLLDSVFQGLKDWITGGSDDTAETTTTGSGSKLSGGSSYVSQISSNQRYGGSTLADKGCGPAAAANVINMMKGGNVSLRDTARYARMRGYENGEGTSADYFGDVLSANGINSNYIDGNNKAGINRAISGGSPTILLGQDKSNTSKAKSPFGPGNHYVVAKGYDRNGNVIVDDPESSSPNKAYSPNILNKTKLAISAGKSNMIRIRHLSGGSSTNPERIKYQDLGSFSRPTEAQLNAYIRNKNASSPFNGNAKIFLEASRLSGLDPRYILAHAALESAWGTSRISQDKHNYFGIAAFDASAYSSAYNMGSDMATGIIEGAKWIREHYYKGPYKQRCLKHMRWNNNKNQYATDPLWDTKIAKLMAGMPENTNIKYVDAKATDAAADEVNSSSSASVSATTSSAISDVTSSNDETYSGTTEDTTSSSTGGVAQGLSSLSSLFSKAMSAFFGPTLGALFGFGDSSEGTSEADIVDQSSMENENVEVDPDAEVPISPSGSTPLELMKSVMGKIKYSMDGARNPEKGNADCSSTVQWAVKKAYGVDVGSTTPAQYNNSNLKTIWYNNGNYSATVPDVAKPNDLLFFSRPTSDYTKGRKDRVGHVGIYQGNNTMIDQPGPKGEYGPVQRQINSGSKLIKVMRVNSEAIPSGSGSGLISPMDEMGSAIYRTSSGTTYSLTDLSGGGFNGTPAINRAIRNKAYKASRYLSGGGDIGKEEIIALIKSIITLLGTLNSNTEKINTIVDLLRGYFNAKGSETDNSNSAKNANSSKSSSTTKSSDNVAGSSMDKNTEALVKYLNSLASGL